MANANETILIETVFWIKELDGFCISPNGLGFLEPDSMLPEIRPILVFVPLEFHIVIVFYSIYARQLQRNRGKKGQTTWQQTSRLNLDSRGDLPDRRFWTNTNVFLA